MIEAPKNLSLKEAFKIRNVWKYFHSLNGDSVVTTDMQHHSENLIAKYFQAVLSPNYRYISLINGENGQGKIFILYDCRNKNYLTELPAFLNNLAEDTFRYACYNELHNLNNKSLTKNQVYKFYYKNGYERNNILMDIFDSNRNGQ